MFERGENSLADFANFFKDKLDKPCDEAVEFSLAHEWEDDPGLCPFEYAFYAMDHFLDTLGPKLRRMGILRLGDDPFWAARAWMSIKGLTDAEYHFLFSRAYQKYSHSFGSRVERGLLRPGEHAILGLAAPGRGASQEVPS